MKMTPGWEIEFELGGNKYKVVDRYDGGLSITMGADKHASVACVVFDGTLEHALIHQLIERYGEDLVINDD